MDNSNFSKSVQKLLAAHKSYSQKLELLDTADLELAASLAKYRDLYKFLPAHRQQQDVQTVEQAFAQHARALDNFREHLGAPSAYEERLEHLTRSLRALKSVQFDFKELIWGHTGPSTHPGLNELLRIIERRDELELSHHLENEWERLDFQEEAMTEIPEILLPIFEELFEDLRLLLEALVVALDSDDCWSIVDEIKEDLLEWGLDYSRHDMDGLRDRCSAAPTKLAEVNFALNARKLCLDNFLAEELSDYASDRARIYHDKYALWVRQEPRILPAHREEYQNLHLSLMELLAKVKNAPSLEHIFRLGQKCIPVAETLSRYQSRFAK